MIQSFYKAAKECVTRECSAAVAHEVSTIPSFTVFAGSTVSLASYVFPKAEKISDLVLNSGFVQNGNTLDFMAASLATLTCATLAALVVSPTARTTAAIVGSMHRAKKADTPILQHLSDVTKAAWSVRKEIGTHHNLARAISNLSHYTIPTKLVIDDRDESMDGLYFVRKCSPLFSQELVKAWRDMPVLYKELSYMLGGTIYAGRTMGEIEPHHKHSKANFNRGAVSYYDQTFGYYNPRTKQIYLAEYKLAADCSPSKFPAPDTKSVVEDVWLSKEPAKYGKILRHEFGHFVNKAAEGHSAKISDVQSFVAAYNKDRELRGGSFFIAEKEPVDREELFAELWAEVNGGSLSSRALKTETRNMLSWMKQFNKDLMAALKADGVEGLRARRTPHIDLFVSKIRDYAPKLPKNNAKSSISYKLAM